MFGALLILTAICAEWEDPTTPSASASTSSPSIAAKSDEIPKGLREYFKRADESQDKTVKAHEDSIAKLEIALRGEGNGRVKADLKKQLRRQQELRDEARKNARPIGGLNFNSSVGEIGAIKGHVFAVVDDRIAVITTGSGRLKSKNVNMLLVITNINAKSLKARQPFESQDLFQVVATTTDHADTLIVTGSDQYRVVEPIKKAEVLKYRAMYDAEKAANVAKGE